MASNADYGTRREQWRTDLIRRVDEWRAAHHAALLTEEEVRRLPTGAVVEIVWSGGNGPHCYTIEQHLDGTYWRSNDINEEQWENVRRWQDPITFVGSERFHTQVRLLPPTDGSEAS